MKKRILLFHSGIFVSILCLPVSGFSQNVGIGTTTPTFKLDVKNGSINTDSVYRIKSASVLAISDIGNLFIGRQAGIENTGSYNTFSGHTAGTANTTGSYNTFFGSEAGNNTSTGSYNTAIGASAGIVWSDLSVATAVGYHAIAGCSNCLVLGGSDATSRTRVGININSPSTDFHIIQQTDANLNTTRGIRLQRPNGTGGNQWRVFLDPLNNYIFQYNNNMYSYIEPVSATYVSSSDERLKTAITPLPGILDKLLLLQPKTYQYTASVDASRHSYGFLAQEVEKLFPDFVFSSENGTKGIAYSNFSVIAVKAIQEQQQVIVDQKQKLDQQQQQIESMLKRIELLEKRN